MRIVMTIPGLEQTSGVSVFCVESANALAATGHDVTVLCSHRIEYRPSTSVRLVCANSLSRLVWQDRPDRLCQDENPCRTVCLASCQPDVVHVHAVWSLFSVRAMLWCLRHHVPVVVSPHGCLMPRVFKKGWLKKWTFWFLLLKPMMRRAAAIHCTSEAEREACAKLGLKGPFVIAPLGVHLPEMSQPAPTRSARDSRVPQSNNPTIKQSNNSLRVLFLGRLSEEKGLLNLLEAWQQLQQEKKIGVENRCTKEVSNPPSNADTARERGSDFQVASDAERITSNWYEVIDPKTIEGMNCIKVPADANPPTDRRAIKDVFQGFGRVENEADGRRVIFPAKSAGKMLGQSGIDIRRHVRSFADMFRKSIRAWSEKEAVIESHKQHRNITAYHQYIVKAELAGSICYVRFTVREDAGGKVKRNEIHSSTISRVTVYKTKGAELSGLGHAQVEDSTPFVDNKISYFLNGVKGAEGESAIHSSTSTSNFDSKLILAGPDWGDYKKVLDEKIAADHIENVEFTGPVHGAEKGRLYREADIFVLPSPMENFSMVVLEALAYGVPVIATKGTPWSELESEKCGCWIDQGVAPLRDALAQLLNAQRSTLTALGANGRALAARRYQWPAIARILTDCYNIRMQNEVCNYSSELWISQRSKMAKYNIGITVGVFDQNS